MTGSANGNVMTPYGALPLSKYAAGGVATSPQLSLFGEGRKPEAYVPLQDGRTIPVTVSGAGGGGGTVVSVQVNIDSNGNSQVESDTSGQKGKQLGDMIQAVVTATIVKEKRQGGLLHA